MAENATYVSSVNISLLLHLLCSFFGSRSRSRYSCCPRQCFQVAPASLIAIAAPGFVRVVLPLCLLVIMPTLVFVLGLAIHVFLDVLSCPSLFSYSFLLLVAFLS